MQKNPKYSSEEYLLARPASRCRRRAYVLPILLSFLNVVPGIRQRVDGSQPGLLMKKYYG